MAVFAYLYYNNYVDKQAASVAFVLSKVLLLDATQQLELFSKLANMLVGEDYLPQRFTADFAALLRKYRDACQRHVTGGVVSCCDRHAICGFRQR